jgi:hypothetical protein
MDLSGFYRIRLPWQEPQSIEVRRVGRVYLFSFFDLYERRVYVEGSEAGYGVTIFHSRDMFRLTRFVVKGPWEHAQYRDWRGRTHTVEVEKKSLVPSLGD